MFSFLEFLGFNRDFFNCKQDFEVRWMVFFKKLFEFSPRVLKKDRTWTYIAMEHISPVIFKKKTRNNQLRQKF